MGQRMAAGGGLAGWLFGRWTYEQLLAHWNSQPDSPFTAPLNDTTKYVASRTLEEPLPWPNSVLLRDHLPEGIKARLRLTESVATPSGVVVATYEPLRD